MSRKFSNKSKILVTGSNGFIGVRVVEKFLERGYRNLRCFVRPSSKLGSLQEVIAKHEADGDVEILRGNLQEKSDCEAAASDTELVAHLAAGFDKSFAGAFMNSVLTTRNLLDALIEGVALQRFVNVSSFAVYSNRNLPRHDLLDEDCPLEDSPQERFDPYGFGKIWQERLVLDYAKKFELPFVILRPGYVFGPGKRALSGRVGIDTFGPFFHMGGSNELPATYVDNCAEAIVLACITADASGAILNVVDDQLPRSCDFFYAYRKAANLRFYFPIPYPIAHLLSGMWEDYSKWSRWQLPPAFNRRRCAAEWRGNTYSNQRLKKTLGWQPTVPMREAVDRFMAQFKDTEDN